MPENSFVVPDAAPAEVPAAVRAPTGPTPGTAGSTGNGRMPRTALTSIVFSS